MRSRVAKSTPLSDGNVPDEENAEEATGKSSSVSEISNDTYFTTRILLLCLGIFVGVVLSSSKTSTAAQKVHRNIRTAYEAHKKAKERYLETYREAYLESVFDSSSSSAAAAGDDVDHVAGTEEELEEAFTVGMFASHINPQTCTMLKSALLNGLDVHLLGFNSSGFKSSGQIDRCETYRDWYCGLPKDQLTAGGATFESILQEDATASNFIRRWRLRNEDIKQRGSFKNDPNSFNLFDYTFSATDSIWPAGMEKLYPGQSENAYKGGGYMDEGVMKNSSTRAVSTGAWIGRSQSLCKLFTKMKQIKDETKETAKKMPGGTLHLQAQVKMAISALSGTPQMKANTIDYDKRFFFSGGTGNPCNMLRVNVKGEFEFVDPRSPNVTLKPLWVSFVERCKKDIKSLWFMKMTKADFRKRTGKTDAFVKLHTFHGQNSRSSELYDEEKKLEELCPYVWDPHHDWAKSLGWWVWGPKEYGQESDVQS